MLTQQGGALYQAVELPVGKVQVMFEVSRGNMPEATTLVMRSAIDQAEAARKREWEEADDDDRADILMGAQVAELFW